MIRGHAGEYSQWYTHSRWRTLRKQQLFREPLCAFCQKQGRIELATICDHIIPHKGDRKLFWAGPFQSLCKPCHDSTKKTIEAGRPQRCAIGTDGWPLPPRGALQKPQPKPPPAVPSVIYLRGQFRNFVFCAQRRRGEHHRFT